MRNRMYGGVRGRKMKVGGKLLHFPPTRLDIFSNLSIRIILELCSSESEKVSLLNRK